MKEELFFGHLGNGISVADKSIEEDGDFRKIAHISYNREVTYYREVSAEACTIIDRVAKFDNMTISVTQSQMALCPV